MSIKKGIFGGSFDPIHLGHLLLAQELAEHFGLQEVRFMPCSQPAHKDHRALVDPAHRLAMVELAVEGNPLFLASDLEMKREGTTYTIDTVRALKEMEPDTDWHFIIGQDSLFELKTWRRIDELLEACTFLTAGRPDVAYDTVSADTLGLPDPWPEKLAANLVTSRQINISSTEIKLRSSQGRSIRYMVPEKVEQYIQAHRLYADPVEEVR